jgi:uncharacterized membrane protein YphA (DoxX/SURF4 family)
MFTKIVAACVAVLLLVVIVSATWSASREFRKGIAQMVRRTWGGGGSDNPADGGDTNAT